ncbi:MAG: GumC family protein, partial [Tepidisphaeraceae bacterium]
AFNMIARSGPNSLAEPNSTYSLAAPPADDAGVPGVRGGEARGDNVLRVVWRRKWSVLAILVACVTAGYVLVRRTTPIYSSAARVYIERSAPGVLRDQVSIGNSDTYLYLQCELIRSMPIVSIAAAKPEIAALDLFTGAADTEDVANRLRGGLSASFGLKDGIITVAYTSTDPAASAVVVNAVVDAYTLYQSQETRSNSNHMLSILQREKDERDRELSKFQKKLGDFKKANGVLSFEGTEGNIVLQRFETLSRSLTSAELATIRARSVHEAAQALGGDPEKIEKLVMAEKATLPIAIDGDVADLRDKLAALRAEREAHPNLGKVNHYQLGLERRITFIEQELKKQQAQAAVNYLDVIRQIYLRAEQEEKELRRRYDEQQRMALELNDRAVEFWSLEAETKRVQELCNRIDARIKELKVSEDVTPVKVGVLERAVPGWAPVAPRKTQTLLVAAAMGLLLGVGAALVQDWSDQRVRTVEEVRAGLSVPVLGIVPHVRKARYDVAGQLVELEPLSEVAEAYRTIRTSLFFAQGEERCKTLMVTSPDSRDGKTVTASNLAIAIAHAGQRTLLVDADLRNPMQHMTFGLDNAMGLSSVLTEGASLGAAIFTTQIKGLDVLPAGPVPVYPSEILNNGLFSAVLDKLARHYDYVIIDSAPVLPVPDSRIIAARPSVSTVMVLRANKSTRQLAADARAALASVGARVVGGVINDMSRGGRYSGYYGGYRTYGERSGDGSQRLLDRARAGVDLGDDAQVAGNGNGNGSSNGANGAHV